MNKSLEEIAFEINNSETKLILLVGDFGEFFAHNLAVDFNYSLLDFDAFLVENNFNLFDGREKGVNIRISIDNWTRKVAYKEQKGTILINGFTSKKNTSMLIKSQLDQELIHLAKNSSKLITKLVIVVDITSIPLEKQLQAKIIENSRIIYC